MSGSFSPGDAEDDEDDEDDEDVPLSVKMDALRRMQQFKARNEGSNLLQSGIVKMSNTPLEVSVKDLRGALRNPEDNEFGEPFLLDVREKDEFDFCKIDGSTLIPLSEMRTRYDEVPQDKTVFVVCHHGQRSMQVVRYLRSRGWKQITNVMGGIDEWSQTVDAKVPRY